MRVPSPIERLTGEWTGTKRLWMDPTQPSLDSRGTARVALVAGEHFASITYTWEFESRAQEGVMLLHANEARGTAGLAWVDSFHMSGSVWPATGSYANGVATVLGSYAAPPGPDWGWRVVVDASDPARLHVRMENITPDGESSPAVEAEFRRATT